MREKGEGKNELRKKKGNTSKVEMTVCHKKRK